jgi:hypothetical protein
MPQTPNIKIYKYDLNGNFIDEYLGFRQAAFMNNTTHASINACVNGRTTHCLNFIYTTEYYIKLPKSFLDKKFLNVNRNGYMKPIHEYDLNGNYIQTFKNYKSIAKTKNDSSLIRDHLINRSMKLYKNKIYKFELYEKLPKEILDYHLFKQTKYINISQYDLEGNFIQTFNNHCDVKSKININKTSIYKSIDNKISTKGFYFTLYEVEKINLNEFNKTKRIYNYNLKSKKVSQYTLDNKFIKTYNSVPEAKKITKVNNVLAAVKGIQKQAGGYIWKYE